MDKKYQFAGEVTMSLEQYDDIILSREKARKEADMYRTAYARKIDEFNELEAKYEAIAWKREDSDGLDGE